MTTQNESPLADGVGKGGESIMPCELNDNENSSLLQDDALANDSVNFLKAYMTGWQERGLYGQVVAIKPKASEDEPDQTDAFGFMPNEPETCIPFIAHYHELGWNLYFAVNPLLKRQMKKASKESIAALAYLHTDNDPKDGKSLDAERERLRAEVDDFSIVPTALINSGNGLAVFWRLDEPIPLDGNAEELEVTNKRLRQHFGADRCHNIDRVMRLPGTVNRPDYRKQAKGRVAARATLLYQNETAYNLNDFDFLPPPADTTTAQAVVTNLGEVNETTLATRLQMVQFDPDVAALQEGKALPWMKDATRNNFDFSYAFVLGRLGFRDNEIVHCLRQYPHGKVTGRKDIDKYIGDILRKVRRKLATNQPGEPGIPTAVHLCTDQANADRLRRAAGDNLMYAAGRWYIWDGSHWNADAAAAYRQITNLSRLIRAEAESWAARPFTTQDEADLYKKAAEALRKWSIKSEMASTLDAAFKLLRNMVEVPADRLDSDPYALNVTNGTIDLRTGKLRPHDKADLLTKIIPIRYDPAAKAPLFEKTVAEITGEAGHLHKPLADFLQRWFGYCATGLTSEQMFAVHHGGGANGKSLLLGTVERILGPYAGVAAPGLLVGNAQERHPTELADLRGKRLVTCYESTEDGVLREETVKRATGSDRIKARYMRQDFFEFAPTHTIQLVTNHKPQIRGQDHAIWRRVLLIPYNVIFGTPAAVERKEAHFVKDEALAERLKAEDEGILAWIVRGAMHWRMAGLNPPDSVLAAGAAYREEQDRVGQFLAECCERKEGAKVPLSVLHMAYKNWMQGCGYSPLGRNKFAEAVEKRPGIGVDDAGRGKVFTGITIARPF